MRGREARRHAQSGFPQGAFESSFVSFEETKEPFYPLGAAISRPFHQNPEKARRAYKTAHELVRRRAPQCLEVFRLILKNGSNRQLSICEMIEKLKTKKLVLKGAKMNSMSHNATSTMNTAKRSNGS